MKKKKTESKKIRENIIDFILKSNNPDELEKISIFIDGMKKQEEIDKRKNNLK